MKLKRFVGADVTEAVAAVRLELGRDAVIIQTRRLRRPGWRGLLRRMDRVEVLAAVEEPPAGFPAGWGWGPRPAAPARASVSRAAASQASVLRAPAARASVLRVAEERPPAAPAAGAPGPWGVSAERPSMPGVPEERPSAAEVPAERPSAAEVPGPSGVSPERPSMPGVPAERPSGASGVRRGPSAASGARRGRAPVGAGAPVESEAGGAPPAAPAPAALDRHSGPAGPDGPVVPSPAAGAARPSVLAATARPVGEGPTGAGPALPVASGPPEAVEPIPWQRIATPSRPVRAAAAAPAPAGSAVPAPQPWVEGAVCEQVDDLRRRVLATPVQFGPPQPVTVQAGRQRVVVLVGPTGAGKTTTVAKLAAHFAYEHGWRVGVVTADTFRAGGTEQLACYARLLAVPCEVAPTPRALERALAHFADCEVVLVDTSGRGHRDVQRMGELAGFIEAARSCGESETHLVLPATLRHAEGRSVALRYRAAGAERLILTKLDECEARGDALGLAGLAELPLSYFAAGQRVPEDIAIAWPDRLAAWVEGGDELVERRIVVAR